jgi:hypothetical protein
MSATQSRGVTSGYFSIQDTATFGQVVSKYGQITRGTVSKRSYNVSGPVTPYQCVVPLNRNPVLATINGVCGNNVVIHYKDELGESGEFFGNAVCT